MPRMYQQYKVVSDAILEMDEALSNSRSVSRFLFWALVLSLAGNAMQYYSWVVK